MLVKTNDYEVTGDMPGQAVDMTLASESLEHIMDILSDLYSNRPAAIVREYGTNALDSHIISGQTRPVEITTPNRLNPNLIIRDYGNGMSKQVLIDTYSKYGASTKRDNNLEAGQLGLGSKSGFAYTDQFTVRSVHQGHCCELIMSRNDRGAAEMTIAFDYATGDDSGVTVTIPIKTYDVESVAAEVDRFAKFAKPGSLLVNGVVNEHPADWVKIADNLYVSEEIQSHIIVMGNVAYPAELFAQHYRSYRDAHFVAFVEMGEVDFVPSREQLKYTPYTKRTIAKIESYVNDALEIFVKESLGTDDSLRGKLQAHRVYSRWGKYMNSSAPADLEAKITQELIVTKNVQARLPNRIDDRHDKIRHNGFYMGEKRVQKPIQLHHISELMTSEFYAVTEFSGAQISREQARKVISYNPDWAGKTVCFFGSSKEELESIFKNWKVVSWDDLKKIPDPKPKNNNPAQKIKEGDRYRGDLWHNRMLIAENKLMKTTGAAYYCSKAEFATITSSTMPRGDFKLFLIPPAKQEAFTKKNPDVKSMVHYVNLRRSQIENHIASSPNVVKALPYSENKRIIRRLFDISQITNSDFIEKVRLAHTGYKWNELSLSYHQSGEFGNYLRDNYPLVSATGIHPDLKKKQHIAMYINMIGEKNVNA